MNESYVTVAGNLTAEPERHIAVTGSTFATFRVASTERRPARDGNGYTDIHTSYYQVIVWRKLAENVLTSVRKGHPVIVSGRVRVKEFTRKDETPGTSIEIEGYHVGHNLQHGTTTFAKGQKQPVIDGDRSSDPAVNALRENGWGAPDLDPSQPDTPSDFVPFPEVMELDDPYADAGEPDDPFGGDDRSIPSPSSLGSGASLV